LSDEWNYIRDEENVNSELDVLEMPNRNALGLNVIGDELT
jgi:hypothetical protein